jgi:hypothetical protein
VFRTFAPNIFIPNPNKSLKLSFENTRLGLHSLYAHKKNDNKTWRLICCMTKLQTPNESNAERTPKNPLPKEAINETFA